MTVYLRVSATVLVFFLSYGGFLVAGIPASWVTHRLNTRLEQTDASVVNVHGTAWHGAGALDYGRSTLGTLTWTTSPWPLLTGRLAANLWLRGSAVNARARVSAGGGKIVISDLHGRAALPLLVRLAQLPAALNGTLVADIPAATVDANGRLASVRGRVEAHGAHLSDLGVNLGTLVLKLQPSHRGIRGTFTNSGGDLQIRGNVTLGEVGNYTLHATLQPGRGQNQLRDGLAAVLGAPDAQGRYHYDASGRLQR